MNSTGVLDDYLDELLGEAIAPAAVVLPTPDSAAPVPDSTSEPEREPTWDDLPAEVIYETDSVAAGPAVDNAALEAAFEAATTAEREPTWDDLPAEVIYETDAVAVAPAQDDAALEAAFEAAAVPVAAPEREPTWDDLPDEVIHETTPAKAGPEPTSSPTLTAPVCRLRSKPLLVARMSPRRHRPWLRPRHRVLPPRRRPALPWMPRPPTVPVPGRSCRRRRTSPPAVRTRRTAAPASAPRAGCACAAGPRPMRWNC